MEMKDEGNENLDELIDDITPTEMPSPQPSGAPTVEPSIPPTAEPTAEPISEPISEPTKTPTATSVPEEVVEVPEGNDSENITFTVKSGMSSRQVSVLLVEKGLIDNANEFNEYIVKVGKASVIHVGDYILQKDASYEEIMLEITK